MPADDALDRHDLGLAAEGRAAGQQAAVHARRQVHPLDVRGDQVVRLAQLREPEGGDLRQQPPLVRDGGGQNPVEGADPVGADQQQAIAQVVNIPHFAPPHRQTGQRRLRRQPHCSWVKCPCLERGSHTASNRQTGEIYRADGRLTSGRGCLGGAGGWRGATAGLSSSVA